MRSLIPALVLLAACQSSEDSGDTSAELTIHASYQIAGDCPQGDTIEADLPVSGLVMSVIVYGDVDGAVSYLPYTIWSQTGDTLTITCPRSYENFVAFVAAE